MKRLPIGVEDFKKMIDKNFYYIDKTDFINDVLHEEVVLYTRPRRFGKTLNMSTLYYFFSIKQKENAYLFNGLNIMKRRDAVEHLNKYPVIMISLKEMKQTTFEKQLEMYSVFIRDIIRRNQELLESEQINAIDKELLTAYYMGTKNEVSLQTALKFLCECLQQHYHQNVILLIDEYDVPLQSAYLHGYYDQMVEFLRNVFSAALKTNDALEKGVLTGCLRIAKESNFTGLNNFKVNSIFDGDENQQFGFMQNEIDILLEKYDALEYRYNIKEWYDGYQFGGCDVYNPWSVLMYMDRLTNSNNKSPESFWANTSGNDVIYRFIQQGNAEMKQDFDILSSGGMIEKTIKPELTYRELDDTDNLYSFLLFTGYLKAISKTDTNTYQLMIPNKEIQYIYTTIFEEWFKQQIKSYQASFLEALLQEHVEEANEILNTVLFQSMSYFDYDEKYYHGFLNGMLQGKGSYRIVSNQESGFGRCDLAVLPAYNKNRGLLLELKVAKREEDVEKSAEVAIQQIKEKQYIEGLHRKGYTDILGYGIAFYKKTCTIKRVK
ncbi:ATP-binding protein [[Clostridium] innocuum]|uniref:AAA family ATPase n=1 Tax=Clostridium innocuum TaxID=1522 RepID=UPI001F5664DE|nr:AAA family ATPase [[Clostridium] innocuum]MCI2991128.1 ATP-binding protein [[Clostridium] innocuum]MCR0168908.1 ATP-binding protein [[Clostridium] innocuum]